MEKVVTIEGKKIGLKASAGTIRRYREYFNRDMMQDMGMLELEIINSKTLSAESAGIAENAIWTMAKEYSSEVPDIQEWLDSFSPAFIYGIIAPVLLTWRDNIAQMNKSKKKI